ncbi:MarR family transcriptional regulator [Actinoplanes sp. NPDC051861]|uniref:MarR family winged helix-turn-helix transcriptional regulator n=1 Tax=Actinoplanes sp. NPDC051861 TaxID=3155170 RepID=UPI00344560AD
MPYTLVEQESSAGWTIVRLAHVLSRRFEAAMRPHGLTPTQFGVLTTIAAEPGIGSGELARRVLVTAQSVGESVASLEAAGLVARDRSAGRGRRAAITLTARGRSVLAAATLAAATLDDPEVFGLSAPELATLNALLGRALRAQHETPPA